MTEERKQELYQLLNEAMVSWEARPYGGDGSIVCPVDQYRSELQKRWTFYSERPPPGTVEFFPYITNGLVESRILDFIRVEFAPFIHEDKILSACFAVLGGSPGGYPLEKFLWQLLRIAIARGVDEAVLAFDRCTEDTPGHFKVIVLLENMKLETTVPVFDGIQLMPLGDSPSAFPAYVPELLEELPEGVFGRSLNSLKGQTLLIIDHSVSPKFHKPPRPTTENVNRLRNESFRTKINSTDISPSDEPDFPAHFCRMLS